MIDKLFLGIDGGQSHTEAVIADEFGNILGIGLGGALNHGNLPDGRARLKAAIKQSVNQALQKAGVPALEEINFASAHGGLTGGADYKEEIVRKIIRAEHLSIGHDALTALFGATGGKPGIVVIAGTGSMVFGINQKGETARAGGLGFLFTDEGSGFWLAVETIKLAIKEQDRVIAEAGWQKLVFDFFKVGQVRELTNAFYNQQISRDQIAGFAKTIARKAESGDVKLRNLMQKGAEYLVENVKGVAKSLDFTNKFTVSAVGGMFQEKLMKSLFVENLRKCPVKAEFCEPVLPPAPGALLLAYQQSRVEIDEQVLLNLKTTYDLQS